MTEDLQNIDIIFLDALAKHEEMPSPTVWKLLNEELNSNKVIAIGNLSFNWLVRIIALCIFMFLFLAIHDVEFIHNAFIAPQISNLNLYGYKSISTYSAKEAGTGKANKPRVYKPAHGITSPQKKAQAYNTNILAPFKKKKQIPFDNIIQSAKKNITPSIENLQSSLPNQPLAKAEEPTKEMADSTVKEVSKSTNTIQIKKADTVTAKQAYTFSKNKISKNVFAPYWSLTIFGKREWTQYDLENDVLEHSQNPDDRKAIAKRENHEPSYMIGSIATYQFKKHLAFQAGLECSRTAISIDPQKIYAAKNGTGGVAYKYNTSSGYVFLNASDGMQPAVGDSLYVAAAQHTLEYVNIPIMMRYNLNAGRFSFAASMGLGINLLTAAKIQTEIKNTAGNETVDIKHLQGLKSFNTDIMANAEIAYAINKRSSLSLIPAWRHALSPINKNNVVKTFPYSFGLGAGFSLKF